ncbi:uncharacterized protein BDV14DRAFT_169829 [Aspergillus stella-maris]|uniref:uncharacterized protein n=1 Tax=Aspergillus stella-maris TaxID=1810926 RepID=UPI003CCDD729
MVLDHFTTPIITTTEPQLAPAPVPDPGNKAKARDRKTEHDPNIPDHRLNLNRPCIYERRLPNNAYITAHVQRLQHGHYSTNAVSDRDIDHADFLAINFVFHSPDTLNHRFKAATIRASLHYPSPSYTHRNTVKHERPRSSSSSSSRSKSHRSTRTHPHFLMHAPHFLHGAVSPETLQWNYSLAGSLGVAQLPLIASLSPAAGLNGRFNRYEMLRVQGSVRTYHGAPASQIVWTLEENTLQRSGLPREFTFAMLVARPGPIHERRVELRVEIEPVLQSWIWGGAYPGWWLKLLGRYRASRKRGVDFRGSVGQRFGTGAGTGSGHGGPAEASGGSMSRRGFNFATLVNSFDEYVSWQGKKVEVSGIASTSSSRTIQGLLLTKTANNRSTPPRPNRPRCANPTSSHSKPTSTRTSDTMAISLPVSLPTCPNPRTRASAGTRAGAWTGTGKDPYP